MSHKWCCVLPSVSWGVAPGQFVPLLGTLTFNTWLRWHLPDFSTVKLTNKNNKQIFCGERVWDYVNILFLMIILPDKFNIHGWDLPISNVSTMAAKSGFSNSIIPSTFISWHSALRRRLLFSPFTDLFLYRNIVWWTISVFILMLKLSQLWEFGVLQTDFCVL